MNNFSRNGQIPQILGDSQENPQKLYVYRKFRHQEIRWKALYLTQCLSISTFSFLQFLYTVLWRYKKVYLHASTDILLLQSSPTWVFAAVLATPFQAIVPKYLQCDWLRGRQYSPYLCKKRNMHCSVNMRQKIQMADSQSPPENQLKRHVLV